MTTETIKTQIWKVKKESNATIWLEIQSFRTSSLNKEKQE